MKKTYITFFIVILSSTHHFGQNLIPNNSFELIDSCFTSMLIPVTVSAPWYPIPVDSAGNLYVGDPDLHNPNCPNGLQSTFWDTSYHAANGVGFAGIIGGLTNNGFFLSEGMGVPFTEPLEAGEAYYFEAQIRSKGTKDGWGGYPCPEVPKREVNFYAAESPTRMTVQYSQIVNNLVQHIEVDSEPIMKDTSTYLDNIDSTDWNFFCDCFVAQGDEQHFGIIGPTGFRPSICNDPSNSTGYSKVFYYDFDELSLVKMPKELSASTTVCEEAGSWVHLRDFVPMPMFDKATYRWENGCTDSVRLVNEIGFYEIDVIMPCTTVKLYLDITATSPSLCQDTIDTSVDTLITLCGNEREPVYLIPLLENQFSDITHFVWEDGSRASIRILEESAIYPLEVHTICQPNHYFLEVKVEDCGTNLFVPNAFTPNNDGHNDRLEVFLKSYWEVTDYQFQIFDRWGSLLYSTTNPTDTWNGATNGQKADEGVYVWLLRYTILENGEVKNEVRSGDVLLMR